jgi:hypothetical protein
MAPSLPSCHGRWCYPPPNATACQNVTNFVNEFRQGYEAEIMSACCEIYCSHNKTNLSPLLALKCQGATTASAISIWVSVVVVVFLAFLHLLGGMLPGGSRKYTTMGSLAVKQGLATYFLVTFSDELVDTILYPIVAAMDFAIFSFFFSGFQYSIGIGFEAAPITMLIFTVFPLYRILSFAGLAAPELVNSTSASDQHEHLPRAEAVLMLALALLWSLHSAIYRTISYRAHWIEAWKKQENGGQVTGDADNAHMSRLWYLAAGHGHPTWHTPVGRSVGLLMLILSWSIVVQSNDFLKRTCTDDFVLFRIMLYMPPILLTLAILSTEIYLLRFANGKYVDHLLPYRS